MKRLLINGPSIAVVVSMIIMSAFAYRSAPGTNIPERLPLDAAEQWMADALIGVGPKSKQTVTEQLRTHQLHKLPNRTRDMVPLLFVVSEKNAPTE